MAYWVLFLSGSVDEFYINKRRKLGKIHAQIDLPLETYLAGMSYSLSWFSKKLELTDYSAEEKKNTFQALNCLCNFDISLVAKAYKEASDQYLVEQSKINQSIMDASLDPMITIDIKGKILFASLSVERIFGWRADELVGKNIKILMPDPYRSNHDGYLQKHKETGITNVIGKPRELRAINKEGKEFDCEISIAKVETGENGVQLFTGIVRDITERKSIENKLDENTKKLEESAWYSEAQNQLNVHIRGKKERQELARDVITFLSKLLNASIGALYLINGSEKLRLEAGYAFVKRNQLINDIEFGEGLVGQAALEKSPIMLTDVPEDYTPIRSGLGKTPPRNVLVFPFSHNNSLMGVLEFGSTQALEDKHLELLKAISNSIGIAFTTE